MVHRRLYDSVRAHARGHPDKLSIIDAADGSASSYAALLEVSETIARAMLRVGVTADAPVLLVSEDSTSVVALVVACNALGLTLAPLDPSLPREALARTVERLSPGAIVHDAPRHTAVADALDASACTVTALSLESLAKATPRASNGTNDTASAELPWLASAEEPPFLLTLSSGSTGEPKPVVFSDRNKAERALATARVFEATADDTFINASPFHHSLGQRLTFMPLTLGATMVLARPFSATGWLTAVRRFDVSFTIAVSSHLAALQGALTDPAVPLGRLRALVSSSASIDAPTRRALARQTRFRFFEMYGASEVATATVLTPEQALAFPGSVGTACEGVELVIVDDALAPQPTGTIGEILVRSPLASPGYYRRPDLTEAAFVDGWFRTGDLGRLDQRGHLHFIDRRSDTIVTGGVTVHPSGIEAVARAVDNVQACLAIGVPDAYLGEAIVAVVQAPDAEPRALEVALRRAARDALADSQRPLAWYVEDALPLGASGKLDRRALRERYAALGLDLSARFRETRKPAA